MSKKILITGATGFIGKNLVCELAKNKDYNISCLVRKTSDISKLDFENVSFVYGDLLNNIPENLCEGVWAVVHLAGQMGKFGLEYDDYYKLNCEATKKLVEESKNVGVTQFIFCSTPGVYGFGTRLAKEDDPYSPRNPYEETKVEAEKTVIENCGDMKYTILRPDFVYGIGDMRRIKMYKSIKNGKFILTTNGKSYLHPTYIDDVVQGFVLSLGNEKAFNEAFNIAAEHDVTALEYLSEIANAQNVKLRHINVGRPFSVAAATLFDKVYRSVKHKEGIVSKSKIDFLSMDHSSSIEKAKRLLGYSPKYDIKKGLEKTLKWIYDNNLYEN